MKKKGIKYILEIIRAALACGENELNEVCAKSLVAQLMKEVKVVIRCSRDSIRTEFSPRIFWPVEVLDVKEVKDDVETLTTNDLLSKNDPEDRKIGEKELLEDIVPSKEEEKMTPEQRIDAEIDFRNRNLRAWGDFFKRAYEIHKQYNAEFWFHVIGLQPRYT